MIGRDLWRILTIGVVLWLLYLFSIVTGRAQSIDTEDCFTLTRGPITATDHEVFDGYFVISQATTIKVIPDTPAWFHLRDLFHARKTGRLQFCVEQPKQPKQLHPGLR